MNPFSGDKSKRFWQQREKSQNAQTSPYPLKPQEYFQTGKVSWRHVVLVFFGNFFFCQDTLVTIALFLPATFSGSHLSGVFCVENLNSNSLGLNFSKIQGAVAVVGASPYPEAKWEVWAKPHFFCERNPGAETHFRAIYRRRTPW